MVEVSPHLIPLHGLMIYDTTLDKHLHPPNKKPQNNKNMKNMNVRMVQNSSFKMDLLAWLQTENKHKEVPPSTTTHKFQRITVHTKK
jgi:hypothetical protein